MEKALKYCFNNDLMLSREVLCDIEIEILKLDIQMHVQMIDERFTKWNSGMKTMPWITIFDFIWKDQRDVEMLVNVINEIFLSKKISIENSDIYYLSLLSYNLPVSSSDLITSCYKWNYDNDENSREVIMQEHFKMEQKQTLYDYVSFQRVEKIVSLHNNIFDFFFESHVSDPDGIDKIYSAPMLGNMREHSKGFLDVQSRCLSFGKVFCFGDK